MGRFLFGLSAILLIITFALVLPGPICVGNTRRQRLDAHSAKERIYMKTTVIACAGLIALLALPLTAHAQGVVRGAEQGAATGNRAAGPVGGVVGGAVGGAVGGVAGGVKGVLGIPQSNNRSGYHHHHHYRHHYSHHNY